MGTQDKPRPPAVLSGTPENLLALRTGAMQLVALADTEYFLRGGGAGLLSPETKRAGRGEAAAAAVAGMFGHVIEHGPTFLFSEDMQSVLEASVETMPPYPLQPADLFTPEGFVMFPRPVALPGGPLPPVAHDDHDFLIRGLAWSGMTPDADEPDERKFVTFMFDETPRGLDLGALGSMYFGEENKQLFVTQQFTLALFRLLHPADRDGRTRPAPLPHPSCEPGWHPVRHPSHRPPTRLWSTRRT
jgi:hypothetical protein